MSYPNPVPAVLQLGQLNITGNVIPDPWYQCLKFDSGKPNLNAVIILSEIVYWYRPVEIRDENTGQFVGYHQKFKGDKLQRSYQSLADKFGLTKRQARDACHFLEDKGLINLELRTVPTASGASLGNVLFIGIDPEAIAKLTYSDPSYGRTSKGKANVGAITSERKRGYDKTSEVLRSDVGAMTLDRNTYTENTTETSTETTSFPPTPQGEEREERQFKPEEEADQTELVEYETESSLNPLAHEPDCSGCLEKESGVSEDRSSAAPSRNVKKHEAPVRKYNSALGVRSPEELKSRQQRQFDWVPKGPWLVDGKLDPNFVDWQAKDWLKAYGGDLHKKRADVLRHFKKDDSNLAIAWEQYRSEQHHRYSNAALRMQNGLQIQEDEQQQLLTHVRAIAEPLPEEMNPVAKQLAVGSQQSAIKELGISSSVRLPGISRFSLFTDDCSLMTEGVAVGQNRQWQRNREQTALSTNVVAFPSPEGIANDTNPIVSDQRSRTSAIGQVDATSPFSSSSTSATCNQPQSLPNSCSPIPNAASVPTDNGGFAENPDAYKPWKPKPVEGEPLQPEQFRAKLTELTQKLSMPQPQKPEREPKNELEELNQWLADPILRAEAMVRVMKGELPGAALRDRSPHHRR